MQIVKDNEKNIPSLESVANGLTSYFNKLGAVKQLTSLDREFFFNEMANHITILRRFYRFTLTLVSGLNLIKTIANMGPLQNP